MSTSTPAIFLGIAERAAYVPDGNTNLSKWNVLGLRNIVLSNVFPLPLPPWYVAVAINKATADNSVRFALTTEDGKEIGFIGLQTVAAKGVEEKPTEAVSRGLLLSADTWSIIFVPLGATNIVIERPGNIDVRFGSAAGESVGQLTFALVDPPPLTPERISAIRSDPTSSKAIRIIYGCRHCDSKTRSYVGLERDLKLEAEGWAWYTDLPDVFRCKCGSTSLPLDIARRNLHGLLGSPITSWSNIQFVPLYEQTSMAALRERYVALLGSKAREEDLQVFLEANPVLLHVLPSVRLFTKPPILTQFVADFAVVTPQKELVLIEIEKTTTRLMKKDGGIAAELSHAFDQVHSWLHVVDEHRLAVLDSLEIDRKEVSAVRGVVIAGRDLGYDSLHLRRLKGQDRGRVSLYTYDDLLFALDSLSARMRSL